MCLPDGVAEEWCVRPGGDGGGVGLEGGLTAVSGAI